MRDLTEQVRDSQEALRDMQRDMRELRNEERRDDFDNGEKIEALEARMEMLRAPSRPR
jgi:Sec-independent protein translocase protein TatA